MIEVRPLRYSITSDGLIFAGSETGMIKIPEENIIKKGRLGPGELIAVDLKEGKLYKDKEIKDYVSREYKKFNSQIIDLDKKLKVEKEEINYSGNELRRRQYHQVIGVELILHPVEVKKLLDLWVMTLCCSFI